MTAREQLLDELPPASFAIAYRMLYELPALKVVNILPYGQTPDSAARMVLARGRWADALSTS
jgi:hypothetical protein